MNERYVYLRITEKSLTVEELISPPERDIEKIVILFDPQGKEIREKILKVLENYDKAVQQKKAS